MCQPFTVTHTDIKPGFESLVGRQFLVISLNHSRFVENIGPYPSSFRLSLVN